MLQDQNLNNHAKKRVNFYAYEILVKASIYSVHFFHFFKKIYFDWKQFMLQDQISTNHD